MAYFLKTSHYKKGDYIQIYYSFRDPETRQPRNKCYKTLGYIEDLKASGIADPVSYYRKQIELLNEEHRKKKNPAPRTITEAGASRNIGYFPAQMYWNVLHLDEVLNSLLQGRTRYNAAKCVHDLVMGRFSDLFSLRKDTWATVHALYGAEDWSREEIRCCLEFLGSHLEEIIDALHPVLDILSGPETEKQRQYLGLTLYYLESSQQSIQADERIDADHADKDLMIPRRIMAGISLDEHLIPSGLRIVASPSEEAICFEQASPVLSELREKNARKIRIADKLLNDPKELYDALRADEGYLFARNMNSLSKQEEKWVLDIDEKDRQKRIEQTDLSFFGTNRISFLYEADESDFVLLKSEIMETPYSFVSAEDGSPVVFVSQEKLIALYSESRARKEKTRIMRLMDQASQFLRTGASESDFGEASRYITKDENGNPVFNQQQVQDDLKKAGCQILVTTELDLEAEKIMNIYGELWRVKEIMKNQKLYLDRALSEAKTLSVLKGSFLVCFIALILDRLARLDLLEDQFLPFDFDQFVDNFLVVEKLPGVCINLTEPSEILQFIERKTGLALSSYELDQKQIQKMLEAKPGKSGRNRKKAAAQNTTAD